MCFKFKAKTEKGACVHQVIFFYSFRNKRGRKSVLNLFLLVRQTDGQTDGDLLVDVPQNPSCDGREEQFHSLGELFNFSSLFFK